MRTAEQRVPSGIASMFKLFCCVPSRTVPMFERFCHLPSGIASMFKLFCRVHFGTVCVSTVPVCSLWYYLLSSIREWKVSISSREAMTNAGMSNSQHPSLTELQLVNSTQESANVYPVLRSSTLRKRIKFKITVKS